MRRQRRRVRARPTSCSIDHSRGGHVGPTASWRSSFRAGAARAAYQAGVARAIAEMLPEGAASPFRIVAGPSAGAINAAALAAGCAHFRTASTMLCRRPGRHSASRIFIVPMAGTCPDGVADPAFRCFPAPTVSGRSRCSTMRRWRRFSCADRSFSFDRAQHQRAGALDALTITASELPHRHVGELLHGRTWARVVGALAAHRRAGRHRDPALARIERHSIRLRADQDRQRVLRRRCDGPDGADRAGASSWRGPHPGRAALLEPPRTTRRPRTRRRWRRSAVRYLPASLPTRWVPTWKRSGW